MKHIQNTFLHFTGCHPLEKSSAYNQILRYGLHKGGQQIAKSVQVSFVVVSHNAARTVKEVKCNALVHL